MTVQDIAQLASYVCPWGTMVVAIVAFAHTIQKLSGDGVFAHLFGGGAPTAYFPQMLATPPPVHAVPTLRARTAAQVRVTPTPPPYMGEEYGGYELLEPDDEPHRSEALETIPPKED